MTKRKMQIEFSRPYSKLNQLLFITCRKFEFNKWKQAYASKGTKWAVVIEGQKWFEATLLDCYIQNRGEMVEKFLEYDTDGKYELDDTDYVVMIFLKDLKDNGKNDKENKE